MRIATQTFIALFFLSYPAFSASLPGSGAVTAEESRRGSVNRIEGMKLYRSLCIDCHGQTGLGDGQRAGASRPAPTNFTTPKAVVDLDRARMQKAFSQGHAPDVRREWDGKISAPQIDSVIDYIREAFMLAAPVEDASTGRAIYAKTCSVCHGDRGNGATWAKNGLNPPPYDFTSPKARQLSRRHMINTVAFGSPETAMVGYGIQLDRGQIAAVVDYIRATFTFPDGVPTDDTKRGDVPASGKKASAPKGVSSDHAAHGHAAPAPAGKNAHADHGGHGEVVDMNAPMPNGLKGDEKAGKAFYLANCAVCHGEKGDGKGPRAYFINPKPANFLADEAQEELNRPHLFKSIALGVNGTEMPAWSKVLADQEIANVAEYVFGAFIRPPTAAKKPGKTAATKKK